MNKKYVLIFKTGEAELKALEHSTNDVKKNILPLVEITRGRKLPTRQNKPVPDEQYPFDKRILKIKDIFNGRKVCLDLTSDEMLMSKQIAKLYDPSNGYENWVNFLVTLKEEEVFKEIIPCIILNVEDDFFDKNLLAQIKALKQHFSTLIYRNSILDEHCYDDFELIKDELSDVNLIVIIDSEYVAQAAHIRYIDKIYARISNLKEILDSSTKYVVSSTSFPNNISEIGNEEHDIFSLSEVEIFNVLQEKNLTNIIYSDYGSINPKRNDNIVMARGWIPRIDVPLKKKIFYYRKRRPKGISKYTDTYTLVAQEVVKDSRFPSKLMTNWGIQQIRNCANGDSPGSSPSFWISVRMCIHLEQQLIRLGLLN